MTDNETALQIMNERFSRDTLLSVATVSEGKPYVRIVDAYYEDGSFYTVTYALSNKVKHIEVSPTVAVCGEWFTGHGTGKNLGWIKNEDNKVIADKLRTAFAAWYSNGHTNEDDENTVIVRIKLSDAVIAADGKWFSLNFDELFPDNK